MTITRFWQSKIALLLLPLTTFSLASIFETSSTALAQTTPSDAQGHWAQRCLQALSQQGIFTTYADGTFRPNDAVSRSDYAAIIQRAFPQRSTVQKPIRYRDIRPDHPAARAIQYVQQTGFWVNEQRDEFRPSQSVTRSQAFSGLANGLGHRVTQSASKDLRAAFKDGRMVPDYARNGVAAALENRLIVNYPNLQEFNPNQPIRRAELAASICQALPSTASYIPSQYIASLQTPIALPPKPSPGQPGSTPGKPSVIVVPVTPGNGGTPPRDRPINVSNPGDVVIPLPSSPPGSNPPVVSPPKIPTQEIRGAWLTNIDSYVLFDSRILQDAMRELAQLKFNTVYPVVWNWGYTLYPSEVAKRTFGRTIDPRIPGLQGRDPLAEAVRLGHANGLAVLPWFEFGFMAPADSELVARHPEWLTQRKDGSKIWQEGQYQRVWLNPFKPEVQQFILDLIDEIVAKYGVDGIQFDDHMGLPSDFGYDPYTLELYKKENQGKEPPANPKDPAWLRWRADKITQFMERVHSTVKARKSYAIVALSPNSQKFSYENYLQDWQSWQRRGYVEELILQVYRTDINSFANELLQPEVQEAKKHIPVGVGILTGLKGRPTPISQVQEQIQVARSLGFAGVSFFFYETMWNLSNEPKDYRKSGFQTIFTPSVTRPSVIGGWTPEP